MSNTAEPDFAKTLMELDEGKRIMPWPERRQLAKGLAKALAEADISEPAIRLAYVLVEDPKWEVRSDIANLLLLVPDNHFARLAAKLSEDPNIFVRKAAERALDRRRKGRPHAQHIGDRLGGVHSPWEAFEQLHGKRAAAQARRIADEHFDYLVGVTVHEMRGILTPLKASVTSLSRQTEQGVPLPAGLRRQVAKAAGRVSFLERLLDDMRNYSQPLPSKRRRERLCDVVAEAVSMTEENLAANGRDPNRVSVATSVPEDVTLEIARHHIVAAIANVVKNAFEAHGTGPKGLRSGNITIDARVSGDERVEVVIEDYGAGIPREQLEEIRQFIPGKTTKKNWGTGFGLPIARRYIAGHGGSLGIASRAGEGTTVTIVLPQEQ